MKDHVLKHKKDLLHVGKLHRKVAERTGFYQRPETRN